VRQRAQTAIYAALFCVLAGSAALFFSRYGTNAQFWERFTFFYLLMLVVYTWYLFALLFIHDLKPRQYPKYFREKIAVVIPCYNEDQELVEKSIRTVLSARGLKQVIVIDDGSTNGVQERLRELAATLPIKLQELGHALEHRSGIGTRPRQLMPSPSPSNR
jgi:cellulose synthase/poly-beta-1,6-N-acetylglucosamine synthase-like glycosyltransferase